MARLQTLAELRSLQRLAGAAIMRPLGRGNETQRRWTDGRKTAAVVGAFIKPNERLTSLERLQIYNRQYWFRLIDCLYDDYPGLRAVLGEDRFDRAIRGYLARYPSRSFSLRNLGDRMERFLRARPELLGRHRQLGLEITRFEWAQIVAFDGPALAPLSSGDLSVADAARLRMGLQPYITLLRLHYALDDFSISLKKSGALRGEASQAAEESRAHGRVGRVRLPSRQDVHLAVHRYSNEIYYKRLEPAQYRVLSSLRGGKRLGEACASVRADAATVGRWFENWMRLGWFCRRRGAAG